MTVPSRCLLARSRSTWRALAHHLITLDPSSLPQTAERLSASALNTSNMYSHLTVVYI